MSKFQRFLLDIKKALKNRRRIDAEIPTVLTTGVFCMAVYIVEVAVWLLQGIHGHDDYSVERQLQLRSRSTVTVYSNFRGNLNV